MTSWRRSDSIVTKLIQYVVGSGTATACETFFACYQSIPSLKPCSQQGMYYCDAHCGRLRYYQCRPSIDGQNIYTDNCKTIQFSLDCVLFYADKMCGYSLTIMSLSDACIICSIRQLFPCIVCRILFAGCSLDLRTCSLNARQHIRKRMEGPSLPTSFSDVCFEGSQHYTQDSHTGTTGSHNDNDTKVNILVDYEYSENTDICDRLVYDSGSRLVLDLHGSLITLRLP